MSIDELMETQNLKIFKIPEHIMINKTVIHFDEMITIDDKLNYVRLYKELNKLN